MSGSEIQVGGPMTIHHPSCAADRPVVVDKHATTTRAFGWFGFPSFLFLYHYLFLSFFAPVDRVASLSM